MTRFGETLTPKETVEIRESLVAAAGDLPAIAVAELERAFGEGHR